MSGAGLGGEGEAIRALGAVPEGFEAALPTEGGPSAERELAASNRAATSYSAQLLEAAIGAPVVATPGELVRSGRAPAPRAIGPEAVEQLLVHAEIRVRAAGGPSEGTTRSCSASELLSTLDGGAVITSAAFGEQLPFGRRLREHLDRALRATTRVDLVVLGRGAVESLDAEVGAVTLADGEVEIVAPSARGPLELGSTLSWNRAGTVRVRGLGRWNAVLAVSVTEGPSGPEAAARAALDKGPIASSSVVSLLSAPRLRAAGGPSRRDLCVRSVATGGLLVPAEAGSEVAFATAGQGYGATAAGVRAASMANAGPVLSVAELDEVLGSVEAADEFCAVATEGRWLEYCQKGDLLT